MTPTRLSQIGQALYGPRWHRPMARAIGRDKRTIGRYASGEWPIPDGVAELLEHELRRHRDEIDRLLAA